MIFRGDAPLHEALRISVGHVPVEPRSPTDMRKAIVEAGHTGSAWIRKVFIEADRLGLSGEDRYVLLAFHMLLEDERRTAYNLTETMLKP